MIKRDKDEKETCCDVKKGGLEATTPKLSFVKLWERDLVYLYISAFHGGVLTEEKIDFALQQWIRPPSSPFLLSFLSEWGQEISKSAKKKIFFFRLAGMASLSTARALWISKKDATTPILAGNLRWGNKTKRLLSPFFFTFSLSPQQASNSASAHWYHVLEARYLGSFECWRWKCCKRFQHRCTSDDDPRQQGLPPISLSY